MNPPSLCDTVSFALVSNDHTALNVGFHLAAKVCGIPVVYIQHAQITNLFPPLLYDLSILSDRKSLYVYKANGSVSGEVVILPKKEDKVLIRHLSLKTVPPVSVGVYLTSECAFDRIHHIIQLLLNNSKFAHRKSNRKI